MKRVVILVLWLASAAVVSAQQVADQNADQGRVQEKFVSGGTIRMHLEAGDYTIEGTDGSDIVATYKAKDPDQLKNIHVTIKTSGSDAELWVK